jgi:hypothetical protein
MTTTLVHVPKRLSTPGQRLLSFLNTQPRQVYPLGDDLHQQVASRLSEDAFMFLVIGMEFEGFVHSWDQGDPLGLFVELTEQGSDLAREVTA